jgi:outer membrane protein assembly factor BamA
MMHKALFSLIFHLILSAIVLSAFVRKVEAEEEQPEAPSAEGEENETAVRWEQDPATPGLDDSLPLVTDSVGDQPALGPKYALERILIKGNKKTLRQVIVRGIGIKPGEVFSADDPRLEKARYRLLASGLFYDVTFSLKRGSKRGWAILRIEVKERNTIVIEDIVLGFSEITPYFSIGVAERSLLGSGLKLSAAVVFSREQVGYRIGFSDSHFLNSNFGFHVEGLYANARDFFGITNVCVRYACVDPIDPDARPVYYSDNVPYAEMWYRRAGVRLGTGYTLLGDNYFFIDYRFEMIQAEVPPSGSHISYNMRQPIVYGHLLPGQSRLSSIILGVVRDTRDDFVIPSDGHRTVFEIELSNEILGSSYNFSKFTLAHDTYFPLGKGHAIRLGGFLGLIMGNSPFFNQFFVGDFSSFVPSRVLELNFSHLQPNLLNTSIKEMRYENMALSIGVEYSVPFYRSNGFFYQISGFIGAGVFFLSSASDLRYDHKGYSGFQQVPMDITMDFGVRFDTQIGLFVVSLANLIVLIPYVGEGAAE